MLVVPGKSRISHHSSPPAFGSAPFCSRIHLRGTVAPSVFLFRKCASLLPCLTTQTSKPPPPPGSVFPRDSCLSYLSVRTEHHGERETTARGGGFSLRGPRPRMPRVDFPISVSPP